MENFRIAQLFDEIADLLELLEENEFRIRSYRTASHTIRSLPESLHSMVEAGEDLTELPNIGKATAEKIQEMVKTGTCKRLEELRSEVPKGLIELMRIPKVGPRTVMRLNKALAIQTVEELKQACLEHKVSGLSRFGAKTEEAILSGIALLEKTAGRLLISEAAGLMESLGAFLNGQKAVARWTPAGSFRRGCETIGDLDLLVQTPDRQAAADQILRYPEIERTLSRGPEWLTVRLAGGLEVDFRFLEPAAYGSALLYFTGSKAHNIHLRRLAMDRKWKLNEYGLHAGGRRLAGETEEGVYARLDLPWIPPELREDQGEIEAAQDKALPELVRESDLRGDLHAHTRASDGKDTIEAMADAAQARGWHYLAITDHTRRLAMAQGLDDNTALRHAEAIRREGDRRKGFRLLAGAEVDILKTGRLDLKNATLEQLDWVVASVHYDQAMERAAMTDRILAAVNSGLIHCLGHPLGRLIGKRDPIQADMDRIIEACVANNVRLEINSQPERQDLPATLCRHAKEAGASFVISTDAHSVLELGLMRYGINVARRGWLTAADVMNTQPEMELGRRHAGAGGPRSR